MKRGELQINLATNIAIISMSMLFATLFMGYAIYRSSAPVWPPMGMMKISLLLPTLSTIVIFISSFFCYFTTANIKKNDFSQARRNLNYSILLGVSFIFLQCLIWSHMKSIGLYTHSGIFASITYALTWIHAAHMIAGLIALVYLKKILKPETSNLIPKAKNIENFWYFLEIVWIVMFLTLFVF